LVLVEEGEDKRRMKWDKNIREYFFEFIKNNFLGDKLTTATCIAISAGLK